MNISRYNAKSYSLKILPISPYNSRILVSSCPQLHCFHRPGGGGYLLSAFEKDPRCAYAITGERRLGDLLVAPKIGNVGRCATRQSAGPGRCRSGRSHAAPEPFAATTERFPCHPVRNIRRPSPTRRGIAGATAPSI